MLLKNQFKTQLVQNRLEAAELLKWTEMDLLDQILLKLAKID